MRLFVFNIYMKCFCISETESIWKRVLTVSLRVLIQYNGGNCIT